MKFANLQFNLFISIYRVVYFFVINVIQYTEKKIPSDLTFYFQSLHASKLLLSPQHAEGPPRE